MSDYGKFLDGKTQLDQNHGFDPIEMPDFLFPFQSDLVEWSLRKGRAAIFADTGLGKTPMSLVWADNVIQHTDGNVLIVTPLAVGPQFEREGDKFGIPCQVSRDGTVHRVTVTNYERLHHFDPEDFSGVVCDESSAIKHFSSKRRKVVTEFLRTRPYRLLSTATPSPNDFTELGTSSEALGELGRMDMLSRFFKNDQNTNHPNRNWFGGKWRFRGHAETEFWRWVSSWARVIRKPSDLGYDDGDFELPPLETEEHVVVNRKKLPGELFVRPAVGFREQRKERRLTIEERCAKVSDLVDTGEQAIVWCHLNDEGDTLAEMIPDAVQVAGRHSERTKEERLMGFADGKIRCLITKPKIAAWGLNLQNCSHMTFFPSYSFEQYYQGVRRCWRYGQTDPVKVDIVTTEGELGVLKRLQAKSDQADEMFEKLLQHMNEATTIKRGREHPERVEVPAWA